MNDQQRLEMTTASRVKAIPQAICSRMVRIAPFSRVLRTGGDEQRVHALPWDELAELEFGPATAGSMLKNTLKNRALRNRARQFSSLVRRSAVTPRTGRTHKPKLATDGEMGVTFIGHSSFFLQVGGQNVVIDPNFARWLFVLKRLRQPGLRVRDLPPSIWCW